MKGVIILGVIVGLVLAVVIVTLIRHRTAVIQSQPAKPLRNEWHDRLDELHYLLIQVLASDDTLAQLPQDLANEMRAYFGDRRLAPPTPRPPNALIHRVTRLEDWLLRINAAVVAHPTLPESVIVQTEAYLADRRRRLNF